MRLRDVRKAILKGLASILVSTAQALRRQAQSSEDAPETQPEAAAKEAGGPPAHWLERVKDARVWYGTDGKKPGNATGPGSRYSPRTQPPLISNGSTGALPPAKDVQRRSAKRNEAGQSRRARKEKSNSQGEDTQPEIKLPGSKLPTETQPPARASFRLRRAGDRPDGGEGKPGSEKHKQPPSGKGDKEQASRQAPVLRPQLGPAQPKDPVYRTTESRSEKKSTTGGNSTPHAEVGPLFTNRKPEQNGSPRPFAGQPEQAWAGPDLNPPVSGSLDDGFSAYNAPRRREWAPPAARSNAPEQNSQAPAFDPTARAREIWPDLSRADVAPLRATSVVRDEPGAFVPSARSRWPDLPIDTSDQHGTEAARERLDAEQRERQHEQKLGREQRGDLWSE